MQLRFCYVPRSQEMNAYMPDLDLHRDAKPLPERWEGLTELDCALAENRITEYRWKKAWADPWARRATCAVIGLFGLYAMFVVYTDLLAQ
jgi:hypothetical protein